MAARKLANAPTAASSEGLPGPFLRLSMRRIVGSHETTTTSFSPQCGGGHETTMSLSCGLIGAANSGAARGDQVLGYCASTSSSPLFA